MDKSTHIMIVSHYSVDDVKIDSILAKFGNNKIYPFHPVDHSMLEEIFKSENTVGTVADLYKNFPFLKNEQIQDPIFVYDITDHVNDIDNFSILTNYDDKKSVMRIIAMVQSDDNNDITYDLLESVKI
jgi:hypothetical protein